MRALPFVCWLAMVGLAGCGVENFDRPGATVDEAAYASAFPYYAEFCALSQIKKKPGFGADIRGEIGGHAVFFLNGACRDDAAAYPVLRLCDPGSRLESGGGISAESGVRTSAESGVGISAESGVGISAESGVGISAESGVGISVNAHFRNAKWVAIPGRDFFYAGGLQPGDRLTRKAYQRAQEQAQRLGVYDGVEFHAAVFDDRPEGFSREKYKYEVSVATDYAIGFGRGRFCARVPVTRAQMARMVAYLNDQNAPYRAGQVFHWSVFQDNCVHLAHNALAAAGLWPEWPIHRPLIVSILDFPVPKNEFVNTMRRTDDFSLSDLGAVFDDASARRSLAEDGDLPLRPGALAEAVPPQRLNDIYDTELKLIFYDEPNFGSYQSWFDRIFTQPRYFDLSANLAHYTAQLRAATANRRPVEGWLAQRRLTTEADRRDFADFYARFYQYVELHGAAAAALEQQVRDRL